MNWGGLTVWCVLLIGATTSAGSEPVAHVTGNGRVVVALDATGALNRFYWPGTGSGQHLDEPGARWYIATAEGPQALDDGAWSISQGFDGPDQLTVTTRYAEKAGTRQAEHTVRVLPSQDLVVVRLRLFGFAPDSRICWVQAFLPFDRQVPVFAEFQSAISARNGFASDFDPTTGILEQFRPANTGQLEEASLRIWLVGDVNTPFPRGVYVGSISPQKTACALTGEDWRAWTGWKVEGLPARSQRIEGRSTAILELVPDHKDDALEVVMVIGVSESHDSLQNLLLTALEKGVGTGKGETVPPGVYWLDSGPTPVTPDPELLQARMNLLLCLDAESGAVLDAPANALRSPRCDVLDSAWASAGLDAIGCPELAARALAYHLRLLRRERGVDTPAGSLPRYTYPNGAAASLSDNANPECAAWLLAACCRHALSLPEGLRAAYLEPIWPALEQSADYLAREPRVGEALSGAQPPASIALDTLRTHYLGLESSRRMAAVLGKGEPTLWSDRRSEIYSRIRFRKLNQTDNEDVYQPWIDWWARLVPGDDGGANAEWAVLAREGAPALDASAIIRLDFPAMAGSSAPMARRDALRCLIAPLTAGREKG